MSKSGIPGSACRSKHLAAKSARWPSTGFPASRRHSTAWQALQCHPGRRLPRAFLCSLHGAPVRAITATELV